MVQKSNKELLLESQEAIKKVSGGGYKAPLELSGEFALYAKRITVTINGVKHDFSEKIPEHIWRIGVGDNINNLNDPNINYRIRCELSREINRLVKEFLGRKDIEIIL